MLTDPQSYQEKTIKLKSKSSGEIALIPSESPILSDLTSNEVILPILGISLLPKPINFYFKNKTIKSRKEENEQFSNNKLRNNSEKSLITRS